MFKALTFFLFCSFFSIGQNDIDVKHYDITLEVNDTNNVIVVNESISFKKLDSAQNITLDLISLSNNGFGMKVSSLMKNNNQVSYTHSGSKLNVFLDAHIGLDELITLDISYQGIPEDGLVIGKNKYGNRTFFGDNWPNRAQNWIACNDHPSDKATVRFTIIAPERYKSVANGLFISEEKLDQNRLKRIYKSKRELPTKVMVAGIADFFIQSVKSDYSFPVESWVYPEDKKNGVLDLEVARDPLTFFIEEIGPYPYSKLANVQSTTRYGGMENASCIFYDENAVTGKNTMENLIAHEIAHQWFGNSVTEKGWEHLWLSEGFATYYTNLHLEYKYGHQKMDEQLIKDRDRIIRFEKNTKRPVIDTITTNLVQLLNPNSYQKGAWFLHMLRHKLGKEKFNAGIREYYAKFQFNNASTNDFISVMSEISKEDLTEFTDQWLKQDRMPEISLSVKQKCKKTIYTIENLSTLKYSFPLDVSIKINGKERIETYQFNENNRSHILEFSKKKKAEIILDPNVNLLFNLLKTEESFKK